MYDYRKLLDSKYVSTERQLCLIVMYSTNEKDYNKTGP